MIKLEAVAVGVGAIGNRAHATRGRVLVRAALDRDTGALEPREALLVVDLAREFPARSEEPVVRATNGRPSNRSQSVSEGASEAIAKPSASEPKRCQAARSVASILT